MKKGKFLLTIAAAVLSLSGGVAGAADAGRRHIRHWELVIKVVPIFCNGIARMIPNMT